MHSVFVLGFGVGDHIAAMMYHIDDPFTHLGLLSPPRDHSGVDRPST